MYLRLHHLVPQLPKPASCFIATVNPGTGWLLRPKQMLILDSTDPSLVVVTLTRVLERLATDAVYLSLFVLELHHLVPQPTDLLHVSLIR